MAQQVEHVLGKDEVTGSSPVSSSKKHHRIRWCFLISHDMRILRKIFSKQSKSLLVIVYYRKD